MIYKFAWTESDADGTRAGQTFASNSADNGGRRRIKWRRGLSQHPSDFEESRLRAEGWSKRPESVDIGFLLVNRFIYQEAYAELIRNSTVVMRVQDVNTLQRSPRFFDFVRYLEVRDASARDFATHQLFLTSSFDTREWAEIEKQEHADLATSRLKQIGYFALRLPCIESIVIGFEVFRVALRRFPLDMNDKADMISTLGQLNRNFAAAGLGSLSCTGIGRWTAQNSPFRNINIEARHFNVVRLFEACAARVCHFNDERDWKAVYIAAGFMNREAGDIIYLRHRLAQYGYFGPEKQARCWATPRQIAGGRQIDDWTMKTGSIIVLAWMDR